MFGHQESGKPAVFCLLEFRCRSSIRYGPYNIGISLKVILASIRYARMMRTRRIQTNATTIVLLSNRRWYSSSCGSHGWWSHWPNRRSRSRRDRVSSITLGFQARPRSLREIGTIQQNQERFVSSSSTSSNGIPPSTTGTSDDTDPTLNDYEYFLHIGPSGDWWVGPALFAAKHLQPNYITSLPLPPPMKLQDDDDDNDIVQHWEAVVRDALDEHPSTTLVQTMYDSQTWPVDLWNRIRHHDQHQPHADDSPKPPTK